jgi:F-type H+-transporting ATPase subunit b
MYDELYLIKRYFEGYPWALVQYSFDSYRYNVYKSNNSIEVALKSADKAKEEMASLNADNHRILTKAKNERDLLLKEAREIQENILSEAKESKKQIRKQKQIEK